MAVGSVYRTSFQNNLIGLYDGFTNRLETLWRTTKDHYLLMPTATVGIVTAAVIWNPVGLALTAGSLALIAYKANQASTHYFLEGEKETGLNQFGETAADIFLLGAGIGLGKAGQTVTQVKNGTNAGIAFHLVDEVAAGILLVKQALQNW